MAAKMAMIATTIINSMRVKPASRFFECMGGDSWQGVPSAEHDSYHGATATRRWMSKRDLNHLFVARHRGLASLLSNA